MRQYTVQGTKIGANGVNYGKWLRIVVAETAREAESVAVNEVQGQGFPTNELCITSVQDLGQVFECTHCGKYH